MDIIEVMEKLSSTFDEIDRPNRIYIKLDELRAAFWKKYHINRYDFQKILQQAVDDPVFREKIRLAGGTSGAYRHGKRPNYIEIDGKRYLFIEIKTPKHNAYMGGRR